ncbi:MAG TPA: type II 3-dehydroquinate dehydratase [Pseudomonadota bacterium]|nr:type II 3-dehydroquinate dehydratase [Xanthomonadales bacterium]HQW81172.1 type II 3-dehydroquinate dehydratase [Pseudomonadota bacterium]
MAKILLLNGPNLNLLGEREPGVYGQMTLAEIELGARALAAANGHELVALQSNSELAWIERLHAARTDGTAFIVVNPGAFTHQSVAIRDAITATSLPFIEVHLSNVHAREPFRHRSLFSDRAVGVIAGLGPDGYEFALTAAFRRLHAVAGQGIHSGI